MHGLRLGAPLFMNGNDRTRVSVLFGRRASRGGGGFLAWRVEVVPFSSVQGQTVSCSHLCFILFFFLRTGRVGAGCVRRSSVWTLALGSNVRTLAVPIHKTC